MVKDGEVENAVVTAQSKLPGLAYERCREEKLVWFAAARGPFNSQELSLAEFARLPLIMHRQGRTGAARKLLDQLERADIATDFALRSDSIDAVKNAVRSGTGIGMLYRDSVRSEIDSGEVIVVEVAGLDMRINSSIVYSRAKPLSPEAVEFLQLMREARREATAEVRCELRKPLVHALSLAALWLPGLAYSLIDSLVDAGLIASTFM